MTRDIHDLRSSVFPLWFKFFDGGKSPVSATLPIDPDRGFVDRLRAYPALESWLSLPVEYYSVLYGSSSILRVDAAAVWNPGGSCRAYGPTVPGSSKRGSGLHMQVRLHGRTIGVRYKTAAADNPSGHPFLTLSSTGLLIAARRLRPSMLVPRPAA